MQVESNASKIRQTIMYLLLIACSALMVLPFLWMLSASVKLDKDVFSFPIDWIPAHPRWANYRDIWTTIPLGTFIRNTVKLTLIVTFLQLFTSSFAAYAFSKLHFRGRDTLFLGYVATIAMPWQVYMVPQFVMMSKMGLNNTHLAIILLQAFSAFGVFMMKQFYTSIPTELYGPPESFAQIDPCRSVQRSPSPTQPISTLIDSVTPAGTEPAPPWPTSS